jgi:RNA polymerase sigma factor (sigma-70 family)
MSGISDRPGEVAGDEALARRLAAAQGYLGALRRGEEPGPAARDAWEEFFRAGDELIQDALLQAGLGDADRADCAQDVWKKLTVVLPGFVPDPGRGAAAFPPWLQAVARHAARDHCRRAARRATDALDARADDLACPHDDPATVAERADEQARAAALLAAYRAQAPPAEFEVVRRCLLEGRPLAAAATVLGLTPGQVRHRKRMAIEALRTLAARRGRAIRPPPEKKSREFRAESRQVGRARAFLQIEGPSFRGDPPPPGGGRDRFDRPSSPPSTA